MQPAGQRRATFSRLACTPLEPYNTPAGALPDFYTGERMMDTAASGWYYALNGERVGPRSLEEVRSLVANGVLEADSLVWTDGMREWARVGDFSILSPTWVQPVSAPAPRAEAEWTPAAAPAPAPRVGTVQRPGRRFGARVVDTMVYLIVVSFVASLLMPDLATRLPANPAKLNPLIKVPVTLALALIEGLVFHVWGTTPGKALFGIRVTTEEGGRLSLSQSFARALQVWVLGLGMGLPLLDLLVPLVSFFHVWGGNPTFWDKAMRLRVEYGEITPLSAMAIAGFVLLFLVLLGSAISGIAAR
ncbi:MAG TPA: RDD family protein [Longimicrobium sp.]|jgi:uncharacterized RDD family membrane protein YckC